jgi:hypothetical protein
MLSCTLHKKNVYKNAVTLIRKHPVHIYSDIGKKDTYRTVNRKEEISFLIDVII